MRGTSVRQIKRMLGRERGREIPDHFPKGELSREKCPKCGELLQHTLDGLHLWCPNKECDQVIISA